MYPPQPPSTPPRLYSSASRTDSINSDSGVLASFTAAVRDYVPTSLVPNALPTPPRLSQGGAFGLFSTGPGAHSPPSRQGVYSPPTGTDWANRRRSAAYGLPLSADASRRVPDDSVSVFNLDEDESPRQHERDILYPTGSDDQDSILYAGFDVIEMSGQARCVISAFWCFTH
jgi:hypothetical protein